MLSPLLKSAFWITVEDCLISFHKHSRQTAAEQVDGYRRRLLQSANSIGQDQWMEDLIYHSEPWQLACDLANNNLDRDYYRAEYAQILTRNGLLELEVQSFRRGQIYPTFAKGQI
jgi:hypothetical protein